MTLIVGGEKATGSIATESGSGFVFCEANFVANAQGKFRKSHD
jgi:hypothetical protein